MQYKAAPHKSISAPPVSAHAVSEPMSRDSQPTTEPANSEAYAKVRRLIEAGRLDEAESLARSRYDGPMKNALGVCLMRAGKADEAVRVYRPLVLDHTGLFLRGQVPAVYKTNFAYALMLSGRISGGLNIARELAAEDHPSVRKLQSAIEVWKANLSLVQKLGLALGLEPKPPLALDFPPGDLI